MTITAKEPNYMLAREHFLRCRARFQNHEEALRLLLGAANTGADMEAKMLDARNRAKHMTDILKLSELGTALDKASDSLDFAAEMQRRRISKQQAEFNGIFRNLDE